TRAAPMADLLRRVATAADAEAFSSLFETYAPRVKSYMMRQGTDAATAEELAQETMLAVWRKASLYSADKCRAATWIFTIARNLRIDRLRRQRVWQELPDSHQEEADDAPLPEQIVAEREASIRVQAALAGLPADQLEVV